MITGEEISRSIYGAWRLARLDANGMRYFDGTEGAFWRSFFAAVLLLPAYGVLISLGQGGVAEEVGAARVLAVESISYVIGWTAFPLVAYHVLGLIDRGGRYFAYITAYNWGQVVEMGVLLAATLLAHNVTAASFAPILSLVALSAILYYEWFIARSALNVPGLTAAGLVIVSLLITIFLKNIGQALLRAPAAA